MARKADPVSEITASRKARISGEKIATASGSRDEPQKAELDADTTQPYWVKSGFIRSAHVQAARQYLGTTGPWTAARTKSAAFDSEFAELAARSVYQIAI